MLRSMLYVRKGSGCSRRVTASAARPSATRSCDSIRAKPSAGVNRSPAIAFSSTGAMSEDNVDSLGGNLVFNGQLVKPGQPLSLGFPQSVIQVLRQVINGYLFGQAQQGRLAPGDGMDVFHSTISGRRQQFFNSPQVGPARC